MYGLSLPVFISGYDLSLSSNLLLLTRYFPFGTNFFTEQEYVPARRRIKRRYMLIFRRFNFSRVMMQS